MAYDELVARLLARARQANMSFYTNIGANAAMDREAAAAISALQAERDEARDQRDTYRDERDNLSTIVSTEIDNVAGAELDDLESRALAAETQRDRLAEALRPFAAIGKYLIDNDFITKPDDHGAWGFDDLTLTYGDLRRARAALSEAQT